MDDMLPQEQSQLATKADLRLEINSVRSDVNAVRSELKEEVAAVRFDVSNLRSELHGVRSELKTVNRNLTIGLIKTNSRIDDLEQRLTDRMEKNMSQILGAIDSSTKKAEAYDQKTWSHGDILQQHESRLGDHEKRIGSLETKY